MKITIPPYGSLPPSQKQKYKDEVDYVLHQTQDPQEIDAYFSEAEHQDARKMLEAPFRLNTAVMAGLSAATTPVAVGRFLNVAMGMLVPCGGLELYEGLQHGDRDLVADGAFNIAIGASSVASALAPVGPLTLAPIALLGARELYCALAR